MPHTVQVTVTLTDSDIAETGFAVQAEAGGVFGHHLDRQGPVTPGLRDGDQPLQQGRADPVSVGGGGDIDADLSDPAGASAIRHVCERCLADDFFIFRTRNQSTNRQMAFVPGFPSGSGRHKGGNAGRQAFGIERAHLFSVIPSHVFDGRICSHVQSRCWPPVTNSSVPVT